MRARIKLLFLMLLALSVLPLNAQRKQVFPVDEAYKDSSFKTFRDKLIRAARNRDAKHILSITDKNIKIGFGGDDGIGAFRREWKLTNPKSEFWKIFLFVIANGGAFQENDKNSFWSPYIYSNFPAEFDAFDYGLIIRKRTDLKAKQSVSSKTVAVLSYDVVKILAPEKGGWRQIETLDGKKGWVKEADFKSSIDYRAGFTKTKGKWKLDFFAAGD